MNRRRPYRENGALQAIVRNTAMRIVLIELQMTVRDVTAESRALIAYSRERRTRFAIQRAANAR